LNGFLDQLKIEGFEEANADFIIENSEGNKATAVEVTKKFATLGLDLIVVIGTPAAMIVAKEITNVPVVFCMVYDPVGTGIVQDWKSSGNNITGASNKLQLSSLFTALKELAPAKKLAVLYEPNEKNSVLQLKELQEGQDAFQIKVVPVPVTRKEDVTQILPTVIGSVDGLFIAGSSILGEMVPTIVDMATKTRVITLTHLKERVEKGVLLGICANSYAVGLLGGEKAARVLKGEKPSAIPIGTLEKFDVLLNMKTAKEGQFKIPADFLKKVTKKIE
jgi:putative ABC transport system substrate-binding protein